MRYKLTVLFFIFAIFAISTMANTASAQTREPINQDKLNILLGKWENNVVLLEIKGLKEDGKSLDLVYNYRGNPLAGVEGESWLEGTTIKVRVWYSDFDWSLAYDAMQGGMLWGELNLSSRKNISVKLYRKRD